jgi:hypothetical protein
VVVHEVQQDEAADEGRQRFVLEPVDTSTPETDRRDFDGAAVRHARREGTHAILGKVHMVDPLIAFQE